MTNLAPQIEKNYPMTAAQLRAWAAMWEAMADGLPHPGPVLDEIGREAGDFKTPKGAREILRRACLVGLVIRDATGVYKTRDGVVRAVAMYRRSAP